MPICRAIRCGTECPETCAGKHQGNLGRGPCTGMKWEWGMYVGVYVHLLPHPTVSAIHLAIHIPSIRTRLPAVPPLKTPPDHLQRCHICYRKENVGVYMCMFVIRETQNSVGNPRCIGMVVNYLAHITTFASSGACFLISPIQVFTWSKLRTRIQFWMKGLGVRSRLPVGVLYPEPALTWSYQPHQM